MRFVAPSKVKTKDDWSTHISAVAAVLLVTKTFIVKCGGKRTLRINTTSTMIIIIIRIKTDNDCKG